ncbi:hypothetical protein [Shinella zoogloeoides]|uniref:hypothetical protein n=1 Tax=Shinella zoogloeoides TaxID=352475 RepID=UPI0028B20761|nr:hypothetical protein [Shinella zoogloeoides]
MNEELNAVAEEQAIPAADEQQPTTGTDDDLGTENQADDLENVEGDGDEGDIAGDDDLVDVEYEGKVHRLPQELKDALLRNADYTRKTQEVAEQRRAVEARQAEINAAYDVSQEVLQARAAILNIDGALKQYEGVNWNQLENEDPVAAMTHWRQFQQLQQQRGQVAQYLDKTQADLSEKATQAVEARLRETRAFAERELKGWTPELDNKITEFATKELGFSVEDLRNQYTPQVYRTLYLAHIGQQALAKQNQQPKPKQPVSPAQPLSKVTARTNPPAGLDDRLSQEEWLKRRNAQVRRG